MLVCLFVINECVLLQACMVALYGRVGTQVGHCRVDVQCRTRILHVHLMHLCQRAMETLTMWNAAPVGDKPRT